MSSTPPAEPPLPVATAAETRAPESESVSLVRAALAAPRPRDGAVLLLVSLVVFVVALGETKPVDLAILVGVLLWHEGGHLVAMRAFGFADVRMFFLPFVGAAVTGRKPGASAVQHAIVSLAGPLPGILLAVPLALLAPSGWYAGGDKFLEQTPWLAQLVMMLVVINALNLLPILPLDGGRLFETLVFARWPVLDVGFRMVTIAALGWLGINGDWLFGGLAVLFLLSLRYHTRIAFDAARLRRERAFPADPAALTDADLLVLYAAATDAVPSAGAGLRNRNVAQAAVAIFDRVVRRPATLLQTLLLLFAWFLGLAIAAGALVWVLAHAK